MGIAAVVSPTFSHVLLAGTWSRDSGSASRLWELQQWPRLLPLTYYWLELGHVTPSGSVNRIVKIVVTIAYFLIGWSAVMWPTVNRIVGIVLYYKV